MARTVSAQTLRKWKFGIVMALLVAMVVYGRLTAPDPELGSSLESRRLSGDPEAKCNTYDADGALEWYWDILYCLALLWALLGLAIICDDYFMASLETISEVLNLSEDVAGATFMAAGSSAPELFTSVMDAFVFQSNVGVGTIVGSAVFNILVIIAVSAAASKSVLTIDWKPLTRDCVFYVISIVLMLLFFLDGEVRWWEALLLVVWYAMYIGFMKVNAQVFEWIDTKLGVEKEEKDPEAEIRRHASIAAASALREALGQQSASSNAGAAASEQTATAKETPEDAAAAVAAAERASQVLELRQFLASRGILPDDNLSEEERKQRDARRRMRGYIMFAVALNHFKRHIKSDRVGTPPLGEDDGVESPNPLGVDAAEVQISVAPKVGTAGESKDDGVHGEQAVRDWLDRMNPPQGQYIDALLNDGFDSLVLCATLTEAELTSLDVRRGHARLIEFEAGKLKSRFAEEGVAVPTAYEKQPSAVVSVTGSVAGDDNDDDEPDGVFDKTINFLSIPWNYMFTYTIPDCSTERWKQWYALSFLMSIVWIGLISFALVEMVTRLGCAIGISPVVMGLTVLAAGTSVPDALSSMVAAREGMGDMACSNAIGSNVFDICLGIGLPYTLKAAIDGAIDVGKDTDLITPVVILLATLFIVYATLIGYKWRLTRMVGIIYLCAYGLFVAWNVIADAMNWNSA